MQLSEQIERRFAEQIVRRLVASGYTAYYAGGCVRDMLMGNVPSDYDVATSATTEQVRAVFGDAKTKAVGEAFGVVLVHDRFEGERCQVEVATFRSDGTYSDGRRPDWVTYSTPELDAQRRDFTINGLFYDPIEQRVIDYVGGQHDIQRRILRAIGDPAARIHEDKLRMLRAVRFAARFGFDLDSATQAAIANSAHSLTSVSGERIGAELRKILSHRNRVWAFRQIVETRLAEIIIPEGIGRWSDPSALEADLMLLSHFGVQDASFPAVVAALVYPHALRYPSAIEELVMNLKERWKLSNDETDSVLFAVKSIGLLLRAQDRPWSSVQPLLIHPMIRDAVALTKAISLHDREDPRHIAYLEEKLQLSIDDLNPPPLVTGEDLIQAGVPRGRRFAVLLNSVRAMQLDRAIASKAEAIEWIKREM